MPKDFKIQFLVFLFCCLALTIANYSIAYAQEGPAGTFVCGNEDYFDDWIRNIVGAVFSFIAAPSGLLLAIVTAIAAVIAATLRELHVAAFFAFVATSAYALRLLTNYFFGPI